MLLKRIKEKVETKKETIKLLDEMVNSYKSINGEKNFEEKWEMFKKYHRKICELYEDKKIFVYAGECDFEYLMTLLQNDGPEYAKCIIFGVDKKCLYEIGVCVRGIPLLKKTDFKSKYVKDIKSGINKLYKTNSL